ncbi:rpap1 c-terminal protein [Cystoisospora suis]|uniref:Rpap1 c-terminal protein n=1 Tax=Cystoisospora suis TaxID=483139 RepID=A0A2C6L4F4_9APIC|nr:rpap1 c-terminal protein [Cystoisospora suis]
MKSPRESPEGAGAEFDSSERGGLCGHSENGKGDRSGVKETRCDTKPRHENALLRQPKKVICLSQCASPLGSADFFSGGDEGSQPYGTRESSSCHYTGEARKFETGQRVPSTSADSSPCLSDPTRLTERGVDSSPSTKGHPPSSHSTGSCDPLRSDGERVSESGLAQPPEHRPPFISTTNSARVLLATSGAYDEPIRQADGQTNGSDSVEENTEKVREEGNAQQRIEEPVVLEHSAGKEAFQERCRTIASDTGEVEEDTLRRSSSWFSSDRATERLADAEIRELTNTENEVDGCLVPSFVLGSVVERPSRERRHTIQRHEPEALSKQNTPDGSGLKGEVQGVTSSYGKGGTGCVPSHAAIEAPFGFPKAVHRSVLVGRRGDPDVCRKKESHHREADNYQESSVQGECCASAVKQTGCRYAATQISPGDTCQERLHSGRWPHYPSDGGRARDSLDVEIERENLEFVARMQPHEIRAAQEEILARFGPQRFAALQRRALRRIKKAGNDGGEVPRTTESGACTTGPRTSEEGEEEDNLYSSTVKSATQTSREAVKSDRGFSDSHSSVIEKSASCGQKNDRDSQVRRVAQEDAVKTGEKAGGPVQCIIEWGVACRPSPRVQLDGNGEARRESAVRVDANVPSMDARQSGGKGSDGRLPFVGGQVKFDMQEVAKLQWANPLGAEDFEGDAAGARKRGEEGKGEGEGLMKVWIERLRFDFSGKLRSNIFHFPYWVRNQVTIHPGNAGQKGTSPSSSPLGSSVPLPSLPDANVRSDSPRATSQVRKSPIVPPENEAFPGSPASLSGDCTGVNDPLEFHRGLHHHGEAAALPGYTLGELLHLSQSASRPQAALAVRTLGEVLKNARTIISFQGGDSCSRQGVLLKEEALRNVSSPTPNPPPFRGGFGVGLERWTRYVLRDLFLFWRLGALLQVQSPVIQREALGALAALLGPADRTCCLSSGDCFEQNDTEDARTHGRRFWRKVCWGAASTCPLFVGNQRRTNTGSLVQTRNGGTPEGDHFPKGQREGASCPPAASSHDRELQQRAQGSCGRVSPVTSAGGTDLQQSLSGVSQGASQEILLPASSRLQQEPPSEETKTVQENNPVIDKHNEVLNLAVGARERSCRMSEASDAAERPDEEVCYSVHERERVFLYPLGGLDFVEESLPEPLPLSSWAGPGGGTEEREGCGSAFSFWQAFLLRVKCTGGEPAKKNNATVGFDVSAGSQEDDESVDADGASMGEVYYRHPVSSLFTWSGLPDRLAFLLTLYEGDLAIERDCLALLVGSCVAGSTVAAQIVCHEPLRQRIKILAESLVVGSAARGRRVQRKERQRNIKPAERNDTGSPSVSARDMFQHVMSSKRAEVAAFAVACGRQLTREERQLVCDLLLFLRVLSRWIVGTEARDEEPGSDDCWFGGFSSCCAFTNQSLMEGLSVLIDGGDTVSSQSGEEDAPVVQGSRKGQEAIERDRVLSATPQCVLERESETKQHLDKGNGEKENTRSSAGSPEVAVTTASSSSFLKDVLQLLAAVEAVRLKRTLISRDWLDDEFLDFFPSLALYVHSFVHRLHQLYGEALLADLALNDSLEFHPVGGPAVEHDADATGSLLADSMLIHDTPPVAAPSGALPEIQRSSQGGAAEGGGETARQVLAISSFATVALEEQKLHEGHSCCHISRSGERVRSDLLLQTEALWTFYGGLAREIFLWATLGMERMKTYVLVEGNKVATASGFEGASLLGPASAVLKALCQHYPPQMTSLSSVAALRVGEAALRFHFSCTSNTILRVCASSLSPASERLASDGDTPGPSAWVAETKRHEKDMRGSEYRASQEQRRVDRDAELLYSRWQRSIYPVLSVLLGSDADACLPNRVESDTNAVRRENHMECEDVGQCDAGILSSFSTKLLASFLEKCTGENGERLARSVARYITETGWSSLRRCCTQSVDSAISSMRAGGVRARKGKRAYVKSCWRGIIPATSERFFSPRWGQKGEALDSQPSDGPLPSCQDRVQQTLTTNASPSSGCVCASASSPAFSGGEEGKSCEFPGPLDVELFLTQAVFLTTLSEFITSTLYLLARTQHGSTSLSFSCGTPPHSDCGSVQDLTRVLDAARVSVGKVVTRLCRALRVFLIHLFQQLRWPGVDAPVLHQDTSSSLENQGTTVLTSATPTRPIVRGGCVTSCPEAGLEACQHTPEERQYSDNGNGVALGSGKKEADAKCPTTHHGSMPRPAGPPVRQHEPSVTSGPLLLCDQLSLLMLALLGLRRACTPGEREDDEAEGREISGVAGMTAGRRKSRYLGRWTFEDEQQCIISACSAASTSWTLFKCVVSLYAARETLPESETPLPSDRSAQHVNLHDGWLGAAARWVAMCCSPGRPPVRERHCCSAGTIEGGTAGTITRQTWLCLLHVGRELEQAKPPGRIPEKLWPPPLCVLRSLSSCCRSQVWGEEPDVGSADVEGDANSAERPGTNGGPRKQEEKQDSESGVPLSRPPCMPCQTLFVSPVDVLVGGSLLDSLLCAACGEEAASRRGQDASSESRSTVKRTDDGMLDEYPHNTTSRLSHFVRRMPLVAVDLCNYVPPATVLAVLMLFYSESEAKTTQVSFYPDSPGFSSAGTGDTGESLRSSVSDVYAQPEALKTFWWMLDVWLLQPLGRSLCGGAKEMSADERRRSTSFSDAFVNIWTSVDEACAQHKSGKGTGSYREVENPSASQDVWTSRLCRCADSVNQNSHWGAWDNNTESRGLLQHRQQMASDCPVHAFLARLSDTHPWFPLCCAKAQDVLLSKTARLLFIAQSRADAADPALLLLLWLLASPAFPIECREMILTDTAFLAIADRTFCFGQDIVEWTGFDVSGGSPCDTQCSREGTQFTCGAMSREGRRFPSFGSASEGTASVVQPEAAPSELCQPDHGQSPGVTGTRDSDCRQRSDYARGVAATGAARWGAITPYGEVLWALSEDSRKLMQPGIFLCDEDDKILRSYRCLLATQMARYPSGIFTPVVPDSRVYGLMTVHALGALVGEALISAAKSRRARKRSAALVSNRSNDLPPGSGSLERHMEDFGPRSVSALTKQVCQQVTETARTLSTPSAGRARTLPPADVEAIVSEFAIAVEGAALLSSMREGSV